MYNMADLDNQLRVNRIGHRLNPLSIPLTPSSLVALNTSSACVPVPVRELGLPGQTNHLFLRVWNSPAGVVPGVAPPTPDGN